MLLPRHFLWTVVLLVGVCARDESAPRYSRFGRASPPIIASLRVWRMVPFPNGEAYSIAENLGS
jgi:hypothetical protein